MPLDFSNVRVPLLFGALVRCCFGALVLRLFLAPQFCTKRVSILKTSGNEVYYTNSLILLTKIMLCSKLHCQEFLKLKLFSYEIGYDFHREIRDHLRLSSGPFQAPARLSSGPFRWEPAVIFPSSSSFRMLN